jgi:hypothetical protein
MSLCALPGTNTPIYVISFFESFHFQMKSAELRYSATAAFAPATISTAGSEISAASRRVRTFIGKSTTTWCHCYKTFYGRNLQIFVLFVRLDWKKLTNDKYSSLLQKSIIYRQKKVYNIGPCSNVIKLFTAVSYEFL